MKKSFLSPEAHRQLPLPILCFPFQPEVLKSQDYAKSSEICNNRLPHRAFQLYKEGELGIYHGSLSARDLGFSSFQLLSLEHLAISCHNASDLFHVIFVCRLLPPPSQSGGAFSVTGSLRPYVLLGVHAGASVLRIRQVFLLKCSIELLSPLPNKAGLPCPDRSCHPPLT
jgi:hypothetical protein